MSPLFWPRRPRSKLEKRWRGIVSWVWESTPLKSHRPLSLNEPKQRGLINIAMISKNYFSALPFSLLVQNMHIALQSKTPQWSSHAIIVLSSARDRSLALLLKSLSFHRSLSLWNTSTLILDLRVSNPCLSRLSASRSSASISLAFERRSFSSISLQRLQPQIDPHRCIRYQG